MPNGYIEYTLFSVDIRKVVEIGGKVIEIYESVIYRKNYNVSPSKKWLIIYLISAKKKQRWK